MRRAATNVCAVRLCALPYLLTLARRVAQASPPLDGSAAPCLKFIVNVSAMEGRFYRYKSTNHPHTNMAKAALNMMTRTSAADYAKAHIYMTAVDTGWINDEKPAAKAAADEKVRR